MNEGEGSGTAAFEDYLEALVGVIGHADRADVQGGDKTSHWNAGVVLSGAA